MRVAKFKSQTRAMVGYCRLHFPVSAKPWSRRAPMPRVSPQGIISKPWAACVFHAACHHLRSLNRRCPIHQSVAPALISSYSS